MESLLTTQGRRASQRRVLAATSISYVVVILDTSIVNVALQSIGTTFGGGMAALQWVVNAYTLAFASLLLTGGMLGDRWGARKSYLGGLAVFTVASALCGFAPDMTVLIAARVLQGVGAALLVPCSLTLLNGAYPDAGERARAIGVWAGCGGAALAAGPLAGGVLIDVWGWRGIFAVNVPIGLLGIWLTLRVARDERRATARHFDVAGQIAAIVALGASIAVLIEGGALGWGSPAVVAGIGVSVAAWASFICIEARRAQPMLPLAFFRHGVFTGAAFAAMTTALTSFGLVFVLALYFQRARGYSPLWTGLAFLPLTVVVTGGNVAVGRLVKTYGARWPLTAGLALQAAGFAALALPDTTAPYWLVALPLPLVGLGGGFVTPAATAALMDTVDARRAGIAAGVLNSARQAGAALGVAVFGTLLAVEPRFIDGMRESLWVSCALSVVAIAAWWGGCHAAQAASGAVGRGELTSNVKS
ncbi:MFS transporter [Paraburkholderia sp. SUR17]|uniref:MFS transporter n=1 Tax=Paraburkholderia sp. SUR17 TaxID=3034358 RepID=UPI002407FDC9|nr:MFS transporter [Paraburkholderia sp. SUR17]WEY41785.1 MFS transporter [Paraburkholderia sp. SUR17]